MPAQIKFDITNNTGSDLVRVHPHFPNVPDSIPQGARVDIIFDLPIPPPEPSSGVAFYSNSMNPPDQIGIWRLFANVPPVGGGLPNGDGRFDPGAAPVGNQPHAVNLTLFGQGPDMASYRGGFT